MCTNSEKHFLPYYWMKHRKTGTTFRNSSLTSLWHYQVSVVVLFFSWGCFRYGHVQFETRLLSQPQSQSRKDTVWGFTPTVRIETKPTELRLLRHTGMQTYLTSNIILQHPVALCILTFCPTYPVYVQLPLIFTVYLLYTLHVSTNLGHYQVFIIIDDQLWSKHVK
jgi:hypothetical protein